MNDKIGIYCKVFGLSKNNETGEKSYAGLAIELERNPDSPQETCEELFEKYNNDNGKQLILDIAFLGEKYTVEDVTIITKEEYYRDFSDEEDEEVTDV